MTLKDPRLPKTSPTLKIPCKLPIKATKKVKSITLAVKRLSCDARDMGKWLCN